MLLLRLVQHPRQPRETHRLNHVGRLEEQVQLCRFHHHLILLYVQLIFWHFLLLKSNLTIKIAQIISKISKTWESNHIEHKTVQNIIRNSRFNRLNQLKDERNQLGDKYSSQQNPLES